MHSRGSEVPVDERLWARVPLWWLPAIERHLAAMKTADVRNSVSAFSALRVAIVLSARAGDKQDVWPSQRVIAEDAGLHIRHARRALALLEEVGIVTKRRRQRSSAVYTLCFEGTTCDLSSTANAVEPPCEGAIPEGTTCDLSRAALSGQSAFLRGQIRTFERTHSGRQTENTKQITSNKKISVTSAARGKNGINPSDALIEALLPFTDGSYIKADREARQALQTLGVYREKELIQALNAPRTLSAERPIAFAIAAVRNYGGVLSTMNGRHGHVLASEAEIRRI